jgi:hypothetical protein
MAVLLVVAMPISFVVALNYVAARSASRRDRLGSMLLRYTIPTA